MANCHSDGGEKGRGGIEVFKAARCLKTPGHQLSAKVRTSPKNCVEPNNLRQFSGQTPGVRPRVTALAASYR
jgi:hypothetical protein